MSDIIVSTQIHVKIGSTTVQGGSKTVALLLGNFWQIELHAVHLFGCAVVQRGAKVVALCLGDLLPTLTCVKQNHIFLPMFWWLILQVALLELSCVCPCQV